MHWCADETAAVIGFFENLPLAWVWVKSLVQRQGVKPIPHDITSDGKTVWVNGPDGALGRFGLNGIDVHSRDTMGCLHCTHERTTRADWDTFVVKMREHHGIEVTPEHMPTRLV